MRPAPAGRAAPVWMGKTASAASAHLAPCLRCACPPATPVLRSPAITASAMTRQEGEALSHLMTQPPPPPALSLRPLAGPDCLPLQVPLCVRSWLEWPPVQPESHSRCLRVSTLRGWWHLHQQWNGLPLHLSPWHAGCVPPRFPPRLSCLPLPSSFFLLSAPLSSSCMFALLSCSFFPLQPGRWGSRWGR